MVFYWESLIIPDKLKRYEPELKKAIQYLKAGNLKSLLFEKLKGHDVFSIRLTDANRALLINYRKNNKTYMVIVGIVFGHAYDESPYLNKQVRKARQEAGEEDYDRKITAGDFEEFHTMDWDLEEDEELIALNYYDGHLIKFDLFQQEVFKVEPPLIIGGGPGTGKSCIGMTLLTQAVGKGQLDKPKVYTSLDDKLVGHMAMAFAQTPGIQQVHEGEFLFLPYKQQFPPAH